MILAYRPCFMYLLVLLTGTGISNTHSKREGLVLMIQNRGKERGGKEAKEKS